MHADDAARTGRRDRHGGDEANSCATPEPARRHAADCDDAERSIVTRAFSHADRSPGWRQTTSPPGRRTKAPACRQEPSRRRQQRRYAAGRRQAERTRSATGSPGTGACRTSSSSPADARAAYCCSSCSSRDCRHPEKRDVTQYAQEQLILSRGGHMRCDTVDFGRLALAAGSHAGVNTMRTAQYHTTTRAPRAPNAGPLSAAGARRAAAGTQPRMDTMTTEPSRAEPQFAVVSRDEARAPVGRRGADRAPTALRRAPFPSSSSGSGRAVRCIPRRRTSGAV